jgi:signal transduction histidine kinase
MKEIARLIAEKNGDDGTNAAAPGDADEGSGPDATVSSENGGSAAEATGSRQTESGETLDGSLLGLLFESIPAALAIVGHGKLLRANESFAMAFGFSSCAELLEEGGLVRIFSGVSHDFFADPGAPSKDQAKTEATSIKRTLEARTKSGRRITVPAIIHRLPEPVGIDLLVLHPAEPGAALIAPAALEPQQQPAVPEPAPIDTVAATSAPPTDDSGTIELLAKVSHEVRTPLNSIIGFAELMKDERFGPLGHVKYLGYAGDIVESGKYALGIVNDLLDLSKIQSGNFELNFTAVDANDVIEDCVHLIETQARQDRVVLRVDLDDALPGILADRRSLKQILLNLLTNAVKFTHAGGQVIISSSREDNGSVLLRVRDTGVGMTEDDIALAMKPFRQLDTAPRQQAGTGLGLPLSKALAEANRAQIHIESERRVGTSIDIRFPAERVNTS